MRQILKRLRFWEMMRPVSCRLRLLSGPGTKARSRRPTPDAKPAHSAIEIDIAGGHGLRIIGGHDPEALARLIRGLSV